MILSRRERYILVLTAAILGVLVLDWYVLTPFLDYRGQLQADIDQQVQAMQHNDQLFTNGRRLGRRWSEMLSGGLKTDGSAAESQVLHAVRDWAQDAGLTLLSLKPERSEQEKQFQKITFRATASGTMAQVSRFLWQVNSAGIPVRLTEMQITSRKDGTDDLTLQVGISTIYLRPEPVEPTAGRTIASAREGQR